MPTVSVLQSEFPSRHFCCRRLNLTSGDAELDKGQCHSPLRQGTLFWDNIDTYSLLIPGSHDGTWMSCRKKGSAILISRDFRKDVPHTLPRGALLQRCQRREPRLTSPCEFETVE